MAAVRVTMQEPVLVATSAPGETRWGYHQFPAMSRLPDGSILLMYADAADASETHGQPAPSYRSCDDGATWSALDGDLKPTRPHFAVSGLPGGEHLVVPARPYLDVKEAGLELPAPVASGNTYGMVYAYRVADLPASAQAYFAHLPALRWNPALAQWAEAAVAYDTAGLLAWRREGSTLLPRTFFERQLLSYRGELLYPDYRARYARPDGTAPGKGYTSLMVSADNGRSFRRRGPIALDPADRDMMGEPQLSATADGRLACVIRRTDQDQKPMGLTWSEDSGRTWSPLADLFTFGVWPCLLLLGNGTMVLSYGRPGVHLAFDPAGAGAGWAAHATLIAGEAGARMKHTCGYTSLLPLAEDAFLIAYSDFDWRNSRGEPCKAILTRRVSVGR